MAEHDIAPLGEIHRIANWEYPDAATRAAATGFIPTDLGKWAKQLDDGSYWELVDDSPVTWEQRTGGGGALTDDSVTNAKLVNMAQATIKGRAAGAGTGDPTDLSATQATAILDAVVGDSGAGGTKGLVPAPGAGDAAANKFLKADGTFAVPTGGTGGLGDVVGPASATDEAIARYDSTTGKLLQDSPVTISNDGGITMPEIAAPSTPAAGKVVIYAKSDNKVYRKGEDGVESELGGGGGTNPTTTLIPYNNAGTLADSYLSHVTGSTQTQSAQHIALTNGKALWLSAAQDFGGLIASGKGAVKVVQDNSLDPGTILSNFQTAMPETPTHTIHPWSSEGMNFRHVLDGNTTIGNPGNHGGDGVAPSGYRFLLMLVQDGTGGHTVTWGSDYKFEGGVAPTMTSAANAKDIYEFICFGDIADCIHISQDVK